MANEQHNEYQRKYRQSENGKVATERYVSSEKRKAWSMLYNRSEKRKAARAEYQRSEKGKAAVKRYKAIVLQRIKELVAQAKQAPCQDCQNTYPPCCMDFHHVHGTKRWTIAESSNRTFGGFKEEIAKCILLCANCHRIRHQLEREEKAARAAA